jgi:magnesium transporter
MFAAWVVTRFEGVLQVVPVLAGFALIVNGQSGNAGIQTLTLIVRSLALGELALRDGWRTLAREFAIGALNGLIFGVVVGIVGMVWQGSPVLGILVGAALLLNLLNAALAGTLVPLGLRLLRIDPALASGVLVTTFTDVMGSLWLYGLATVLIRRGLLGS